MKSLPADAKLTMLSHMERSYQVTAPTIRRLMSWNDARTMQRGGIRFGSHTSRHATLTIEQQSIILNEFSESRRMLSENLGETADYLAYPNGAFDGRIMELARASGFSHAFTTEAGFFHRETDPMAIPRLSIADSVVIGQPVTLNLSRTRLYLQQVVSGMRSKFGWPRPKNAGYPSA